MNDIDKAYILLDDELKAIDDGHDCHAGAEDGCDHHTIGYMRLDLERIYKFIITHYDETE